MSNSYFIVTKNSPPFKEGDLVYVAYCNPAPSNDQTVHAVEQGQGRSGFIPFSALKPQEAESEIGSLLEDVTKLFTELLALGAAGIDSQLQRRIHHLQGRLFRVVLRPTQYRIVDGPETRAAIEAIEKGSAQLIPESIQSGRRLTYAEKRQNLINLGLIAEGGQS